MRHYALPRESLFGPVPVVRAGGHPHPVAIRWSPADVRAPGGSPGAGGAFPPAAVRAVAAAVRSALHDETGDVLAFLPGVGEIRRVARELAPMKE